LSNKSAQKERKPMPVNRTRRAGEHSTSADARERILNATMEVAHRYGYQGTTIARVSKEAGLPTGSVYWHFENKDLLLASLIERSFDHWRKATELLRPQPGETLSEHISRIYINSQPSRRVYSEDFWRMGVILSLEKSVPEQVSRSRFLSIRRHIREEFASWFHATLSEQTLSLNPQLPTQLAGFMLALLDGNAIAGASDEVIEGFGRLLGLSVIHLANSMSA
jgi:AcrR family transcriptional regulator